MFTLTQKRPSQQRSQVGEFFHFAHLAVALAFLGLLIRSEAEIIARWDFTGSSQGWTGNARVTDWRVTPDGLAFRSTGEDPWIEGPSVNIPSGARVQFSLRIRCTGDGAAQLFYGRDFKEERSARFRVLGNNEWKEYTVVLDAPGTGTRFRFDPSSGTGDFMIAWIRIDTLPQISAPARKRPQRPAGLTDDSPSLTSREAAIIHSGKRWGGFIVRHGDRELASSDSEASIAVVTEGGVRWLQTSEAAFALEMSSSGTLAERAVFKRTDTGTISCMREFRSLADGGFAVETTLVCDRSVRLLHFPWITLFPGLDTYGTKKHQGLLSGIEYLSDEPSSSEADVRGPNSDRRVPDPAKLTFPLMAIENNGRYIALRWNPSPFGAAVFDSPDRIFESNAHLMALHAPNVGSLRLENEPYAHSPIELKANEPLKFRFSVLCGAGSSVVDAVRHALRGFEFPEVPKKAGGFQSAVDLLAHGWLDSKANEDGLIRHAVWTGFNASAAADAAAFMNWLAARTNEDALRKRLKVGETQTLGRLSPRDPFASGVSHVRPPIAPLLYGRIPEFVASRLNQARAMLENFDDRGVLVYAKRPNGTDYGTTHFANHANGLAFAEAAQILETAALSGNPSLLDAAEALLDKLTRLYHDTVPRGAQTWEVPLHTPDILASAHLVKTYTIAYRLTGRPDYLDEARYWAWTGIPFVYLSPPVNAEIGLYATTPVLGATGWVAPYWIGLPVQWCGLVYASALHDLALFDHSAPWTQIATGITATGLQMTWPHEDSDRQGLLPDVFHLRDQVRDGPAINPGTVQAHLPELFNKGKHYSFVRLSGSRTLVHAAGAITVIRDGPQVARIEIDATSGYVLLAGLRTSPARVNALEQGSAKPVDFEFDEELKIATFPVGKSRFFELGFGE